MTTTLPIFPLNTVLFPQALLPLHIFEARYRQMIEGCLEQDSPFGVALIKEGPEVGGVAKPFPRGCLAKILEVEKLDDGRMNLLTVGENRFEIVREVQREPFWKAEVELLPEEPVDDPRALGLGERLLERIRTYSRLYFLVHHKVLDLEEEDVESLGSMAFRVAAMLPVSNQKKQGLLECGSISQRLQMEIGLVEAENNRLQEQWSGEKFQKN